MFLGQLCLSYPARPRSRFFLLCGPGPGPLGRECQGPVTQSPENTSDRVLALHLEMNSLSAHPEPLIKISLSWSIFSRYRVRESGGSSFISTMVISDLFLLSLVFLKVLFGRNLF